MVDALHAARHSAYEGFWHGDCRQSWWSSLVLEKHSIKNKWNISNVYTPTPDHTRKDIQVNCAIKHSVIPHMSWTLTTPVCGTELWLIQFCEIFNGWRHLKTCYWSGIKCHGEQGHSRDGDLPPVSIRHRHHWVFMLIFPQWLICTVFWASVNEWTANKERTGHAQTYSLSPILTQLVRIGTH